MLRDLCLFVVVAAMSLLPGACLLHHPMSPQRANCLNRCTSDNDRCVVEAHTGVALQRCDAQMTNCVAICPVN